MHINVWEGLQTYRQLPFADSEPGVPVHLKQDLGQLFWLHVRPLPWTSCPQGSIDA